MIKNKIYFLLALLFLWGCSTKKNTWMRRNYHNLTAHYNVFFNGNESFKSGVKSIETSNKDEYTAILPVFPDSKEANKDAASGEMDVAIEKGTKLIKKHSIRKKPKKRSGDNSVKYQKFYSQNEFNKWVDNAYLLIGKAQFYKGEYYASQQTFAYMFREFEPGPEFYEAEIWNVRASVEQKDFSRAKVLLQNYDAEGKAPSSLYGFYSATYADYYLRQEKYDDAIPFLKSAIDGAWSRYYKLRLTFILAQVYHRLNMYVEASDAYKDVISMNPPYEMAFNAKVNRASVMFGEGGLPAVQKEITKLIRDKRNKEYQDQIYYALAKAYQAEDQEDDAIDNFLISVDKSTVNNYQKGLSFYELSSIYYNRPEYKPSYTYLDSALLNLDENFTKLETAKELHESLAELVLHLDIIEREDSLQRVAKMSKTDQLALIDNLIEQEKERQKELKKEEEAGGSNDFFLSDSYASRNVAQKGGKWYFYNVTAVGMGKLEFEKKWGRRKLEDNWRRANKEVVVDESRGLSDPGMPGDPFSFGQNGNGAKSDSIQSAELVEDIKSKEDTKDLLSRDSYLKDLPVSEEDFIKSNLLIEEGLLNSGIIYKDELENIPYAIDVFNELIRRFPKTKHLEDVLMNLYLCYEIQNNTSEMARIKNRLNNEFPEGEFTAFLNDPDYFVKRAEKNSKVEKLYEEAYKNYLLNDFVTPITNFDQALQIDEKTELLPKFKLVAGLSYAKAGNLNGFEKEMTEIVNDHSDSDVAPMANELLNQFKEGRTPVQGPVNSNLVDIRTKASEKEKLSSTGSSNTDSDALGYIVKTKAEHSLLILVNKEADLNRLTFNVADYNFSKFLLNDYEMTKLSLPDGNPMFAVTGFKNSLEALDYFYSIRERKDIFAVDNLDKYELFVINAPNKEYLISSGDVTGYQNFFKENYLSAEGIKAGLKKEQEQTKTIEEKVDSKVERDEQVPDESALPAVIEEVVDNTEPSKVKEETRSEEIIKEEANETVVEKSAEFAKEEGAHSALIIFKKGRINILRTGTMFTNYAKINAGPEYVVSSGTKGAAYFYIKVDGFKNIAEAKAFLNKVVLDTYIMREVSRMNPYKWVITEGNYQLLSTPESFEKYNEFYKKNY